MGRRYDPHYYDQKLRTTLDRLEGRGVGGRNAAYLRGFAGYLLSEGISVGRVLKYVRHLSAVSKALGMSFDRASAEDIRKVVTMLEKGVITNYAKGCYTEKTKRDFKLCIKRFYRWLRNSEEDPPETKWIKTTEKKRSLVLPEELLTVEEIKRMVDAATNERDKALIQVLYESGLRVGELLGLRIRHVSFDEHGAVLIVNGKTGMRRVRIISSVPALSHWLESHPLRQDHDAPLWLGMWTRNYLQPLDYAALRKQLKKLAKKAGIKKRVYPHLFRHSRASELANSLTEAQLKQYFGWEQDSRMAAVYVHLSGRDVDQAILKVSGVPVDEVGKRDEFRITVCQRCGEKNSPGARFCYRCGSPLSIGVAMELENVRREGDVLMDMLMKDEKFRRFLAERLAQLYASTPPPPPSLS